MSVASTYYVGQTPTALDGNVPIYYSHVHVLQMPQSVYVKGNMF